MSTEYKKSGNYFLGLKRALAIILVIWSFFLQPITTIAQSLPVSVNIAVIPPYTSSWYDYVNTPNKIMVTFTHTQLDYPDIELYVKASLVGENGIKISTEQGFKPSNPIFLGKGKTFILTTDNISDALDLKHIVMEGIEENELINGGGLPEDYYQLCFQVFDFNTDQPLSYNEPLGCSNLFHITNLEPPIITSPVCGEMVNQSAIQLVQVVWTIPAGAVFGTEYHFEMVEIPNNSTINPNEAFETAAFPPLYEESTKLNSLFLSVQKIVLTPGFKYAFRVRAEDTTKKNHFRNGGYSEICSFIYGSAVSQPDMSDKTIRFISPKDCNIDSVLLAAPPQGLYVGWRIEPFDVETFKDPLKNLPNHIFRLEFFDSQNAQQPLYTTTTDNAHYQADPVANNLPFISGQPYYIQVSIENSITSERILTSERCGFRYVYSQQIGSGLAARTLSGSMQYRFENQEATSYPVANTEVRLKCIYLLSDNNSGKQYEIPEANVVASLGQDGTFPANLTSTMVASTVTASNGNFVFHYSWPEKAPLGEVKSSFTYTSTVAGSITGKLERAMRLQVVNPYYASPQTVVINNLPTFDMGEVTTNVYTYELKAALSKGYKKNMGFNENMVGKTIYIFRKQKLPGIPPSEGNRLSSHATISVPSELKSAGYYLVASEKAVAATNDKGDPVALATFSRLIENLLSGDEYYWYAEGTNLSSAQPLSFTNNVGGNYQAINQQKTNAEQKYLFLGDNSSKSDYSLQGKGGNLLLNTNIPGGLPGTSSLETSDVKITNTGNYSFKCDASFNVISNDPPMSGIKGRLVYEFPGKPGNARPLANRKISLISCLVTDEPGQISKIVKNGNWENYESAFPGVQLLATSKQTDASGNFSFQFPNIEPENPDPTTGSYQVSTGNLNRTGSWVSWESDPEKNFRIVYQTKTVKVKRVFRLIVEDPTGLFMSPDDNLKIDPLETVDVGTLTSNVLSYCLKGGIGWDKPNPNFDPNAKDNNGNPMWNIPTFTMIEGVDCYVLRKKSQINAYQLPSDEGQNIIGSIDELPDFKIIGMTTSNSGGNFTFDNLLFRNSQAPIYLYFKTKDMIGDANFKPVLVNQNCINPFLKPVYLFNADYNYTSVTGFSSEMEPRIPTLKGKVTSNVSAGKGVRNANVLARFKFFSKITNSYFTLERSCLTDTAGYFDFAVAFANFDKIGFIELIESIHLEVKKSGFHYMFGIIRQESYVIDLDKSKFEKGKQYVADVLLYGNGIIKGRIVNEQGYPVDAYVQFREGTSSNYQVIGGNGTMAATKSSTDILFSYFTRGKFEIPGIPGLRQLIIIPKDVTYFADTISIGVKDGETDLGDIKVYERSHRITFDVKSIAKFGNNTVILPVIGAKVSLIGSPTPVEAVTNNQGKVTLSFKNVSESNLSLRVSGPDGSNYVPKVMSFTNYESDKVVQLPTVFLDKGLILKGKVLLDGKPSSEAEIYVELSKGSQTELEYDQTSQGTGAVTETQYLFKAYPKADGTFEINTIPPELNGKQIYIKAVYRKAYHIEKGTGGVTLDSQGNPITEAAPTIIGDEKMVAVPDPSGNLALNLKTFSQMNISHVWGFPIEITKIQPQQSGNKVYVTGRVKLDGYCPGFDPLDPLTLEVSNVLFAPSTEIVNGKPIGIPDQNNVIVSLKRELKMKYGKAFNVKLSALGNSLFSIVKNSDGTNNGSLNATVAIVDNSFQYPSSYLNFTNTNFNFCNKLNGGNNSFFMNPAIKVFSSLTKGNGNEVVKYYLCNLTNQGTAGNLNFKFINFETVADASNSTIEGPEISLAATLKAKVKDAGDIEVKIGKLVLKNNAIASVSGDTPIVIELKDGGIYDAAKAWKFEARNWRIDPKEGGLISENCILHTGTIDIPYSYFNLRSDFAYLGSPETSNINMGGYPITFMPGAKVATGFNASCGGDKKGHWQLIFYPPSNGGTPAKIYGLPNMNNTPLELETVSLLSNGENVFSIGTGAKKMRLFNTVEFKPQMVFSLADGFVLSGAADFHIPRVRDGVGVRLTFVKNAPLATYPKFDPIDLGFEGKGNIKFDIIPAGQVFNANARTFTTYGTVQEPGVLNPIQVKMTYFDNNVNSQIRTEIVESPLAPNQPVKIGEQDNTTYLEKVTCKTKADQNDWDLFVFEGDLKGAKGVSGDLGKPVHMVFTVHGEIKAQQDGFKADGINSTFGGMQITYQKGKLLGTLNMTNVPLGSAIVNGVANILMDSDGWAFYSNCRASGVSAPEPCTLYMGILIGNYPKVLPEMSSTVLAYAINKQMPSTFNNGLKGFYMLGGRELPISGLDIGIDVVVASAYVRVPVAAVDASFYMNFDGDATFGTGLSGALRVEFGLGSITCTDLSGFGEAKVHLEATAASSGSLNLSGNADLAAGLNISQGIPNPFGDCITAINIPVTISGGLDFKTSPSFKVNFYLK